MTTRRIFLKSTGMAMVTLGFAPSFLARTVEAAGTRRKLLIAVFQRGAVDGLNMIVPFGEADYYRVRPSIAVPRPGSADGAVDLNGQWEAVADANGQAFPFLLTLKLDGEKVSGNSSSQLGDATIKTGSWKEGKLSFQLEGSNGVITLSATVIEGKLSGEFDYAGQLQGRWVAVKKN